jgi:hypothetical protein
VVAVLALVDMKFIRCFAMRSLEMQLLLWFALANWLSYVFCMMRTAFERDAALGNRYCSLPLSIPNIDRKAVCILRKGEKQIQVLDGY